ncbi:MAG: head-tail connector protein [Ruminococcus sp.]|nr:head-tail connector protein [Ruminococcus sp.]
MELATIKKFIKVDYEEDDDIIIIMKDAAEQYIEEAVGVYEDSDPLMQLLVLNLVNDMHTRRTYTVTDEMKKQYTTSSIMMQLQLKYDGDDDDDS